MTNPTHLPEITPPDIHTVDIWQVSLDSSVETSALCTTLDTHELERYQHLHKNHQLSYLISHAACRQILAQYLNLSAAQIKYKKNQHGKPSLDHDTPIRFNISHSQKAAIIAISNHAEIGVDIEFNKKKPSWEKIARRFFNPLEVEHLFKQEKTIQEKIFFQIWTRKEAYIKALGTGFATPFASFNVITDNIITTPDTNKWFQKDLESPLQYTAAVVQNTPIEKIRYYSY